MLEFRADRLRVGGSVGQEWVWADPAAVRRACIRLGHEGLVGKMSCSVCVTFEVGVAEQGEGRECFSRHAESRAVHWLACGCDVDTVTHE